jgi:hypothetical protein
MERRISLKAGRGWRRVLLLFLLGWVGLLVVNAIVFHGGIEGVFYERRAHSELPLASEEAVARAIAAQRENSRSTCLPGTIRSTRRMAMTRPIRLWEPPGEPPPDRYGGRPVPTAIVDTQCLTYELLAAHGFWSVAILLGIALIGTIGGWLARGFTRDVD